MYSVIGIYFESCVLIGVCFGGAVLFFVVVRRERKGETVNMDGKYPFYKSTCI
jgi:hypothetical protein